MKNIHNYIKENILVPRNLDGRKEKLLKQNIQLLSQEAIEVNLTIDESFENIPKELIKVKEIKGDVDLSINKGYIPSWLKNIKIKGYFDCSNNQLTSLENCPQYVSETLFCNDNYLISLDGCPKYIGGNLWCDNNNNKVKLELPKDVELKGIIINN